MIRLLLCNFLIVGSLWMFCNGLMSRKYHNYLHELVLFLWLCGSSYCGFLWLRVCLVVLGCFWYVYSKYVAIGWFRMLVLCIYLGCLMISEWVCVSWYRIVSGLDFSDYNTGFYVMLLCSVFLLVFVLLYMVYQMIGVYKRKYWIKNVWMFCVLPMSSLILFLNIEDLFSLVVFDELALIGLFGVLVSNVMVFLLYRQVVKMDVLKEEYDVLESKYDSLHSLYVSNCRFLHDVSRRVFKLKNDNDNELRAGLDEMCCVLFQQFHNLQTDCIPLRNVLMKYQKELGEWQIDVHSDMQIWHSSFCEELFTRLVEYGIAACKNVDGMRSMMFSSYHFHNVDVLKCVFSCNDEYDVDVPFENMYSRRFVDGFCELTFVL